MVNRTFPGTFPTMYLIEGSAYFNLGRLEDAERTARAGIEADRTNFHPRLHRLLGEVLYRKQDYAGARDEFRRYVDDAPDAPHSTDAKARRDS